MKKKLSIIIIVCIGLFLVGKFTGKNEVDTPKEEVTTALQDTIEEPITERVLELEEQEELQKVTEEQEPELIYFETDKAVNDFFVKFNSVSSISISADDIANGNIRTKAYTTIDDFYIEVINVTSENYLSVSISTDPEDEYTVLHDVFMNCIRAMSDSISNEELEEAWSSIHATGYMVEGYEIASGILIDYIPCVELSIGKSNLRIDLTFPIE